MNRREFFREAATGAAKAAGEAMQSGHEPAQTPDSGPRVVAMPGHPRQYQPGDAVYVQDAQAWLLCDELGFYAVDAVCPHLGCRVWVAEGGGFACPCHASRFDASGVVQSGPAQHDVAGRHDLRCWEVDLNPDGTLLIRTTKRVPPGDRFVA